MKHTALLVITLALFCVGAFAQDPTAAIPDASSTTLTINAADFGPYEAVFIKVIAYLTAIVGLARIVVKLTPTPVDDTWLDNFITFLKHIGLNIKTILLLGMCATMLSSCGFLTSAGAFAATPTGEVLVAAVEAEASALDKTIEPPELLKLTTKWQAALAALPPATGNPVTDFKRNYQQKGLSTLIKLASDRYQSLTGSPIPATPPAAVPKPASP